MAITKIDNQAIKLVTPGNSFQDLNKNCNCKGQDFCQTTESGDAMQFQVDLSIQTGTGELVGEGGFPAANCGASAVWVCGAGWTMGGGIASFAAGSTGSLTQSIAIEDNLYYQVTYTIGNYAGGGTGTIELGGKTVTTFTGNSVVGAVAFIFLVGSTSTDIEFSGSNATSYDLDNVSVRVMSTIGLNVIDIINGDIEFSETDGGSITYGTFVNGSQTIPKAQISLGAIGGVISADGCYRGEIVDITASEANLIVNGNFTVPAGSGWVIVGDWTFPVAVADHAIGAGSFESTLQQTVTIDIKETKCYTLTFTVLNYVAGTVTAYVILNAGGQFAIGNASANGTFNFDFEFLDGQNILFGTPNDAGDFQIDDVILTLADKCKAVVFETECIKLQTAGSCNCASLLLTWTNDENAFGVNYEDFTFTQKMRVCAKLYQPIYRKSGKISHLDSDGDITILYSRTTKIERLKMLPMPEYMHDALSIGIEHDTFQIGTATADLVEYINEEEDYEPEWKNQSLLAPVQLEMIKDDQNLVNSNC